MAASGQPIPVITVGLNPAIDRVMEVPGFQIGGHQKGRLRTREAAGKAANVSRALDKLGVRNIAVGFVGTEEIEYFEKAINSPRTATQFLPVAGQTRENVTIVDPLTNIETHIRDAGFTVTPKDVMRMKRKLSLICRPGIIVVFSGSMPPGMNNDDLREMVQLARAEGARVVVDTSGSSLAAVIDLPLWFIKPNRTELAELTGTDPDRTELLIEAGLGLLKTADVVLVTCGKAGGYAFAGGRVWKGYVPVDQKRVVNTVGCGDAMTAGFITATLKGAGAAEAYREALSVATAKATSLIPGEFNETDLPEFRAAARIDPVDLPAHAVAEQRHGG